MSKQIGVFDSGLGGMIILEAIRKHLPKYDYVYYGDTKHMPFGDKTQAEIRSFTAAGIGFLVNQNCSLIIIACNTASAKALRYIQQKYLPKFHPDTKVLGVIIPTLEAIKNQDFPAGLIATQSTVESGIYEKQLQILFPGKKLYSAAAPELAQLIEDNNLSESLIHAEEVIQTLPKEIKSLILGCTHYPLIAQQLQEKFPDLTITDQTKIIPASLADYLQRHPEIESKLSKNYQLEKFTSK